MLTCETCRWMNQKSPFDRSYGQCRRYPPTHAHKDMSFPEVSDDDWCGEHKALPND